MNSKPHFHRLQWWYDDDNKNIRERKRISGGRKLETTRGRRWGQNNHTEWEKMGEIESEIQEEREWCRMRKTER